MRHATHPSSGGKRLASGPNFAGAATAHPLATDAALELMRAGGNAIDAAVAAAWTLAVCEPSASGLGGQTTILLHRPGESPQVIDGHSRAPRGVSIDTVTRQQQRVGHRACVVPSTVATLGYLHRTHGRRSRAEVMEPAIRAAEEGYAVTPLLRSQIAATLPALSASRGMTNLFLPGGCVPPVGSMLRPRSLAATLRQLTAAGEDDFYHGAMAREIVDDMRVHRGLIDAEDLASLDLPVERPGLCGTYRGYRIVTAGVPCGGEQLLAGLRALETLESASGRPPSLDEWRMHVAEASSAAFRRRERLPSLGRPADDVLGHSDHDACPARPDEEHWSRLEEPGDTTHLTVSDAAGNIVALTQSIQSVFGAKVACDPLGFVYNNYLRTCPRRVHPSQLGPRCTPRSNVAPTLIYDGASGRPVLAMGAAGSRRITSALLLVISAVLDHRVSLEDAVAAPRVHGLNSGKVWIERPAASERLLALVGSWATRSVVKSRRNFSMGCVQALQFFEDGTVQGASDPRRDGTAKGL